MGIVPTVREYMTKKIFTLAPDTAILTAVRGLVKQRVSGAPVVDGEKLVGIISERDCLRLVARGVDHREPTGTVADFMSTNVATIEPGMDIYYVAGLFLKKPYRRFPVIEDSRLVGLLARRDVLKAIGKNLESGAHKRRTPFPM